ncbi:hypothetical protein GGI12_001067 [Dipsacomyces acuminosporus]|nr:hypothetical protein GGI12_001067 [Dipsacomyces acuminosporus]
MGLTYWSLSDTVKSIAQAIYIYLLVSVVFHISYQLLFSPLRKLPGPWYTNFTGLVRRYYAWRHKEHVYYMKLFDKYGPLVRAGPDRVGVGEIGDFKKIMSSHAITKSQMYSDFAAVGENVFTTRNPDFNKARRRQIGPAFVATSIKRMESLVMSDGVDRLCMLFDGLIEAGSGPRENAAVVNLYFAFTTMATDVISSLAYGHPFGAMDMLMHTVGINKSKPEAEATESGNEDSNDTNSPLASAEDIMTYTMGTMMLMGKMAEFPLLKNIPSYLAPSGLKKLYELRDAFMKFTEASVARRRAQLDDQNLKTSNPLVKNRHDILKAFIEAQDPDTGAMLNDTEIGSECTVLLAAGTDTTSTTLTSCVRLLLRHQQAFKRACDEVRHAFTGGPSSVTYEKIKESAPYLQAVVYETLRLRPATSGVWPRDSPRDGITLKGHYISHGITLCGSIGGVHLNPSTWQNPTAFDPERFLGPAGEERRMDVVAFSSGVRQCPGRHLALMEILLSLAMVLLKYDIELLEPPNTGADYYQEIEELCRITTSFQFPEHDCNVLISKRA